MMWRGISKRRIIGPCFFSGTTVSVETYRCMLTAYTIPQIRALLRRPIFMHDGTPPNIHGPVKERSDKKFGNIWIRVGGPLAWPPYSPDLNPSVLYL